MKSSETKKKCPCIERDISWIYFNQRILLGAARPEAPLLERLIFLGIYSNNLDEFFRVRVATLNRIIEYADKNIQKEQETATRTLKQINKLHNRFYEQLEKAFASIVEELKRKNICVIKDTEMTNDQKTFITSFYRNKLNGSIIPLFLSEARPLDGQTGEDIYLAIRLLRKSETGKIKEKDYAVIESSTEEYGRFIQLPDSEGKTYPIFLDDMVHYCLPLTFVGMRYTNYEAYTFRFTEDTGVKIDSDLRTSVFQKISEGVKGRRRGEPIRSVYDGQIPKDLLKGLIDRLNVSKNDTRVTEGRYRDFKDLMKFPVCGHYNLKYPVWEPVSKPKLSGKESLLTLTRQKDHFPRYPFYSFDTFIRVLREIAINKEVKSIKMTLYRLAKESKVIKALIYAAKNERKVAVIIELLTRFGEVSNINWSKEMQGASIHVIFEVKGPKVHSKLVHIGTRHGDIVCISTGNFHEGNTRMYTDYVIMTAHRPLVREVNTAFDFIEKPCTPVNFKELLVSPNNMRKRLIAFISREIKNKKQRKGTYILAKVNHITDRALIEKFYEAPTTGVQVELIVRGNCSLVTGIAGISESIRINDIIDRYLEHPRIFIFANGREEKYHIGSADWMPRNLDNRIEALTPVCDKGIQADLKRIAYYRYRDTVKGRIVDGTGEGRSREDRPSALCKDFAPVLAETKTATAVFRLQEELYRRYKNTLW